MNKTASKAIRASLGISFQRKPGYARILDAQQHTDYKKAKREWNAIPKNQRRIQ